MLGALINAEAAQKMEELIADAVAKGGKVLAGGKRQGTVVEATIIDHVTSEMRVYAEESFGPVKPIVRVDGDGGGSRGSPTAPLVGWCAVGDLVFSRDVQHGVPCGSRRDSKPASAPYPAGRR